VEIPGGVVAAVQLLGEQDHFQLRVAVCPEGPVAARCVEVIDVNAAEEPIDHARGVQHRGAGFDEPIHQQRREQKRGQIIDLESRSTSAPVKGP